MKARLCLLMTAAIVAAATEVPFAHADWKPSPTAPVGFAGQGNNWYPGATPPTEWSDSAGAPARNIRWKAPIPGWTDAQPIVVGTRIIGVYSPHHVVCYDAETGKVLWKDELRLMSLPVLDKDGKTIGPVPAADQTARQQLLFERALAQVRVHMATWLHYRGGGMLKSLEERRPLIQYLAETMTSWRADLERDFPSLVPDLDRDLQLYQAALTQTPEQIMEKTEGLRKGHGNFRNAVTKALGLVSLASNWQGSLSDVAAVPVSDGEVVCITMGFGQIAAYEIATGKRLWAWRHPRMNPGPVNHAASPLLWKDLLLIPAPSMTQNKDSSKGRVSNQMSLMAIDKRSGAVRWETPDRITRGQETAWMPGATHGIHESPHLMLFPLGNGQIRALVISGTGHLVDAETGAALGQLRGHAEDPKLITSDLKGFSSGHGFTATLGDRVYRGTAEDNFSPAIYITQLRLEPDNTIGQIPGPATELRSSQGPFALSDSLLALGKAVHPQTGATLADLGRPASAIIAGQHLILADSCGASTGPKQHDSSDVLALSVRVLNLADPAKPRLIATNVIQAKGHTPDISAQYFPRFATEASWRRWGALAPGHVNYQGIGFNFTTDIAGLTAHGKRIYVHSPSWLYCIGEK